MPTSSKGCGSRLGQHASIRNLHYPLSLYLDRAQDHALGLELGELTLTGLDAYPKEALTGMPGAERGIGVVDGISRSAIYFSRPPGRSQSCLSAGLISHRGALTGVPADTIGKGNQAGILHQLGTVAQEQRRWPEAEEFYQKALALYAEFNDRYRPSLGLSPAGHGRASAAALAGGRGVLPKGPRPLCRVQRPLQTGRNLSPGWAGSRKRQRRWPEAEEFYPKALTLFVRVQRPLRPSLGLSPAGQGGASAARRCGRRPRSFTKRPSPFMSSSTTATGRPEPITSWARWR